MVHILTQVTFFKIQVHSKLCYFFNFGNFPKFFHPLAVIQAMKFENFIPYNTLFKILFKKLMHIKFCP